MDNVRYVIVEGSVSAHCCFGFTLRDLQDTDEGGDYMIVCETFYRKHAELLCKSLNDGKVVYVNENGELV